MLGLIASRTVSSPARPERLWGPHSLLVSRYCWFGRGVKFIIDVSRVSMLRLYYVHGLRRDNFNFFIYQYYSQSTNCIFCKKQTMERSPSSEAGIPSASQQIPRFLYTDLIHYHVHKSPPIAPILSQMNLVYFLPSCFSKIQFNIILLSTP